MLPWWNCKMMLVKTVFGARRQFLLRCMVVRLLARIRVKVLWCNRLLSDINRSYMDRIILAITAALELVVLKVLTITIKGSWGQPKDTKANFKGHLPSQLRSSRIWSGSVVHPAGTTTRGSKPRNNFWLRRSTNVVINVLVCIVASWVAFFMIVLSQSPDSFRHCSFYIKSSYFRTALYNRRVLCNQLEFWLCNLFN
jgi:hypothetical protein